MTATTPSLGPARGGRRASSAILARPPRATARAPARARGDSCPTWKAPVVEAGWIEPTSPQRRPQLRRRLRPLAGPVPAGRARSSTASPGSPSDTSRPAARNASSPPGGPTTPASSSTCCQRGFRRLPDRLLLLPVLRLRGVPARLLVPAAAAGGLHPRPGTAAARATTSSGPGSSASREFGPGAVIYHEGARYQVVRVTAAAAQPGRTARSPATARRCEACGYLHARGGRHRPVRELRASRSGETHPRPAPPAPRSAPAAGTGSPPTRRSAAAPASSSQTAYRFAQHGAQPGRLDADGHGDDGRASLRSGLRRHGDRSGRPTSAAAAACTRDLQGFLLDVDHGRWLKENEKDEARRGRRPGSRRPRSSASSGSSPT